MHFNSITVNHPPRLINNAPTVEFMENPGSHSWVYFRDKYHLREVAEQLLLLSSQIPDDDAPPPEVEAGETAALVSATQGVDQPF